MKADKNLVNMPTIGFGTYLIPNEEAQKTINTALKIGYRHIDTAEVYRNEVGIGLGLKNTFSQLSLQRNEVFITFASIFFLVSLIVSSQFVHYNK